MIVRKLDREEVDQFTCEFQELFYAGDYVGMASYYASDAKLLAEDTELVQGHPALERFWQIACEGANKVGIKRTIRVQHFESSGDLGYLTGIVTMQIPNSNAEFLTNEVRYATVWKRENDGVWRILIDISNRQPS